MASFSGQAPFVVPRPIALRDGVNVETISAGKTLTLLDSTVQRLNGGASDRTITLPSVSGTYSTDGFQYLIVNSGSTNDLIVSDGATVATVVPGGWAQLWSDGTDWYVGASSNIKPQTIADPGDGAAIPVTNSGSIAITTAAAETNTLADPTFMGQWLSIFVDTYAVGDRVITAASRINQAGNTIITLGAAGDFIKLEAITIGGALKWQVVANDGAALS